jgi:geranylgeranyl diphosphate synthase type II
LTGDALLNFAFQLLAEHAIHQDKHPPDLLFKIMVLIARAAGHEGMIEGQMRDIAAEGRVLSVDQLEQLHRLKTGALISASVQAGAMIGGGDKEALSRLETYGRCIGLAFQVTDDILNEIGDPQVMGKAVGTDQLRKKNTYPSLIGLDAARRMASELVTQALRSLDIFDTKSDPLRFIAHYVSERQR